MRIRHGSALPFGPSMTGHGVNFAIFSSAATDVWLVICPDGEHGRQLEFKLDPYRNKTGDVWHALVEDLQPPVVYGWRMDRRPNDAPQFHKFNPEWLLLDPYAPATAGGERWGLTPTGEPKRRFSLFIEDDFEWDGDQPLNHPLHQSVIYETHLRGFTKDPSSGVSHPGTFRGLIEKIPHLLDLGVTAVELLPVFEFEEADSDRINPLNGERLVNYWGYQPISFFAPNASYASQPFGGGAVHEFKEMVRELHNAGIGVILDVVFNHTAEGNEHGPTYCWRGIDNSVYYMLDPRTGEYLNYSGCGNTLNCNHPVVRSMIVDCLRRWVMEMHVDGFRFDLASILGRGEDGSVLANPPLLEALAADPVLANAKLIAEAWDAAGLYQVGTFPSWGRWAEWNGHYRDDVRRFVKSDPGMVRKLAKRIAGSPDLYQTSAREPYHSVNFVTAHDGFTLDDLVSYNGKHNLANGEDNRDGANDNASWNCGIEGATTDAEVIALRQRQAKNLATILLLSHGVPMFVAGDEFLRTQQGNNNAYCQDNGISWIDWNLALTNADQLRFFRHLIRFRENHQVLRPLSYYPDSPRPALIVFHGTKPFEPDWGEWSRSLAVQFSGQAIHGVQEDIYLAMNSYWEALEFTLPLLPDGRRWHRVIDTMLSGPAGIAEIDAEVPVVGDTYRVGPRACIVLLAK